MRTRCGYTGGTKKNPTYYKLGDHTESIQIDYDPKKISYEELLKIFWKAHNPCFFASSRQYMSAVFYQNDEQKKLALKTQLEEARSRGQRIVTKVLPITTFYLAEGYHQKYYLKLRKDYYAEMRAIYPNERDLINSTAAARVNGYIGGAGTRAALVKEVDGYGLSAPAKAFMLQSVRR